MNNSVALKRQFDDKCITYEKEDYLDCVIYCVVHYKLYGLGEALAYLRFTLGKQIDAILSSWQTGSYYADLQAVYEHLQSDNNPPP